MFGGKLSHKQEVKLRKEAEKGKTPVYNYTQEQLNSMRDAAVDKAVAESLELMLGIPAMVLFDKFGFTEEMMNDFIDKVESLYNSVCDRRLTLQDIRDALTEECGARIENLSKVRTRE